MKNSFYTIGIAFLLFTTSCQKSEKRPLNIPQLFSDHMVLQHKTKVEFWGEYTPEKKVILNASWGSKASTEADIDGKWKVKLPTPIAGGPYSIKIETSDSTIIIDDVLIGEVWLASGQSNMTMPLKGWPPFDTILNSDIEIGEANYPNIRMLTVEKNLSNSPLGEITGEWVPTSPENAGDMSATAYFFARRLHKELNVPVGIIHSSWGGTVAEAWTSKESLRKLGDFDTEIDSLPQPESKETIDTWFSQWPTQSLPETTEEWKNVNFSDLKVTKPDFDDSQWNSISLPGSYDELPTGKCDGAIWLRKKVVIENVSSDYTLTIGAIDDMDATYFNGEKVGGLAGKGVWNAKREIAIPKSLLVKGENIIAIRALDTGGSGTVKGPVTLSNNAGSVISLSGLWQSQIIAEIFTNSFYIYGTQADVSKRPDAFRLHPNLPTVLYNAMIAPLVPYTIKGAIWYQGESNVRRHEQYQQLFPTLIRDWRKRWNYDFPFYFVQIAPYAYTANPNEHVSQKLRDVQHKSLKTPKTGMVVTLDIGNPTNIHPANKQDVGSRLAGLALANDYGKELVASGPLYKGVQQSGNSLIIEFDYVGSGLLTSETGLTGFEIAGADKVYVPAMARIVGETVEVTSRKISSPQYVRYAWRDTSTASLFNNERLPASSFTSEE